MTSPLVIFLPGNHTQQQHPLLLLASSSSHCHLLSKQQQLQHTAVQTISSSSSSTLSRTNSKQQRLQFCEPPCSPHQQQGAASALARQHSPTSSSHAAIAVATSSSHNSSSLHGRDTTIQPLAAASEQLAQVTAPRTCASRCPLPAAATKLAPPPPLPFRSYGLKREQRTSSDPAMTTRVCFSLASKPYSRRFISSLTFMHTTVHQPTGLTGSSTVLPAGLSHGPFL